MIFTAASLTCLLFPWRISVPEMFLKQILFWLSTHFRVSGVPFYCQAFHYYCCNLNITRLIQVWHKKYNLTVMATALQQMGTIGSSVQRAWHTTHSCKAQLHTIFSLGKSGMKKGGGGSISSRDKLIQTKLTPSLLHTSKTPQNISG